MPIIFGSGKVNLWHNKQEEPWASAYESSMTRRMISEMKIVTCAICGKEHLVDKKFPYKALGIIYRANRFYCFPKCFYQKFPRSKMAKEADVFSSYIKL